MPIEALRRLFNAAEKRELSYHERAINHLKPFTVAEEYKPVEKAERNGKTIQPGDFLRYNDDSPFPGLKMPSSGEVEYIYETENIEGITIYAVKLKHKQDLIEEPNWLGFKSL